MIKVTLKDGSVKELESACSVFDVAKEISSRLAKAACVAKIDGEIKDLRTVIDSDCTLEILTFDDEDGKKAFRHTASHILAQAVKRLYPEVKLAIGPAIDNGFYYDFDKDTPFMPEDLEAIEAEMKKIVKEDLKLEQFEMAPALLSISRRLTSLTRLSFARNTQARTNLYPSISRVNSQIYVQVLTLCQQAM